MWQLLRQHTAVQCADANRNHAGIFMQPSLNFHRAKQQQQQAACQAPKAWARGSGSHATLSTARFSCPTFIRQSRLKHRIRHSRIEAWAVAAASADMATSSAVRDAVAIDVEYAHFTIADGQQVAAPAWVALVDQQCRVVLKTYISPQVQGDACWFGGVSPAECAGAPTLPAVLQQLQGLTDGKLLLGHGLAKDLAALGWDHPQELRFDTMTHPAFGNKAGNARSLQRLAKKFLGLSIQQGQFQEPAGRWQQQRQRGLQHSGRKQQQQHPEQSARLKLTKQAQQGQPCTGSRHDPEEDAAAVMQLYNKVVVPSSYEGQVASATAKLLQEIQARRQQLTDTEP